MAWLEIHQSLLTHRKTIEAAEALDLKPVYLLGHIVSLWLWALDNAPTGTLGHIKPRTLARVMDWTEDPQVLLGTLLEVGFLDNTEDGLVIHDWWQYAGKLLDRRNANVERQKRFRDAHVTDTKRTHNGYVTVTSQLRNVATQQNTTQQYSTEPNIVADSIADEAQAEPEPLQFSEDSEPHRLASLLKSLILTNNPTARLRTQTPKQFQGWCAEIDRMLRRDERTPGNIEAVIRWSQSDDFWKQNILSPSKLREKFDQLWLRVIANPKTIPRAASPPIDTSPIVEDPEGRAFIDAQIREQEEWDAKHRKRTTTTASTADRRDSDGILSSLSAVQGCGLDGAEADQRGGPGGHQPPRLGDADEVRVQPLARGTNGQNGPPARIHRLAPRG